jgi:hypothetical protein
MDNKLLSRWWKILLHLEDDLLHDPCMPLVNLDSCLEHFHLALPALPIPKPDSTDGKELPEPGFENLTLSILDHLRKSHYAGLEKPVTAAWAEKLLRFCEIRSSSLSTRTRRKWGNHQIARLNFLQVTTFLLDYGKDQGDLRFLNIILKLTNQKWLFNTRGIIRGLRGNRETALAALFQIRILLLSEYLIDTWKAGNLQ